MFHNTSLHCVSKNVVPRIKIALFGWDSVSTVKKLQFFLNLNSVRIYEMISDHDQYYYILHYYTSIIRKISVIKAYDVVNDGITFSTARCITMLYVKEELSF